MALQRGHRKLLVRAVMLLAAALAAGCAALPGLSRSGPQSLVLDAMPNANRNTATAVDVVFVYSASVARMLPDTALAWFTRREQLLQQSADQMDVVSLEVAPGQRLELGELPRREAEPLRVAVFAWMATPAGQAVLDLTDTRHPVIRVGAERLRLSTGG